MTLSVSSGCSALNSDLQSQTALELTTAQSLQVILSDVSYVGCNSGSTFNALEVLTFSTSSSISAVMYVHIPLSQFEAVAVPSNTSSVLGLFTQLQQKLVSTVQSGAFTKQLSSVSKYLNASVTSNAVVSKTTASGMTIQNPPTLAPTVVPPSSKSAVRLDTMYIIIGIVSAGVVLLLIAVCFLVAYIWHLNSSKPSDKTAVFFSNPASSSTKEAATETNKEDGEVLFGREKESSATVSPDLALTESACSVCFV